MEFDCTVDKLRELHCDVLIALTARSHGARLITSDRADFELIRAYRIFQLEIWRAGADLQAADEKCSKASSMKRPGFAFAGMTA